VERRFIGKLTGSLLVASRPLKQDVDFP